MTKAQRIAEIREQSGFRRMRMDMFPDWMDGTRAYLAKRDEEDAQLIHYIRCGVMA